QIEDLHAAVQAGIAQVVHAAADRLGRVAGEADDQVDFDLDADVQHRFHTPLERLHVVLAVHQCHGQRVDRLQADFDLGEVGVAEQLGDVGVESFSPQFAKILPLM